LSIFFTSLPVTLSNKYLSKVTRWFYFVTEQAVKEFCDSLYLAVLTQQRIWKTDWLVYNREDSSNAQLVRSCIHGTVFTARRHATYKTSSRLSL